MRMVEVTDDHVVMSMPIPRVRRHGDLAAGALIQLADVGATSICLGDEAAHPPGNAPVPVSIQISDLIRNTDSGTVFSKRLVPPAATMVAESTVRTAGAWLSPQRTRRR
jgi:hypothetical protein